MAEAGWARWTVDQLGRWRREGVMAEDVRQIVAVPDDDEMAMEPAVTIGKLFASKALLRTYIAALVGIVAGILKVTVDDEFIDNLSTAVLFTWPFVMAAFAKLDQWMLAHAQAKRTREAVYAPETVRRIAEQIPPQPVIVEGEPGAVPEAVDDDPSDDWHEDPPLPQYPAQP